MKPEEIKITEEEWEGFQPPQVLSPDISDKLWNNINKTTTSPAVHYSYFRWMAAAASVLLVVGLSWVFILKKQKARITSGVTVAITKNIFNNTPQKMMLTLSDGSTVELLPKSTLSYPEKFNSFKRDVILNGEANFNIAKDVAKPFSVYSPSVLITVLGTRFTVNSYGANNATKVILHEGRVMIKIFNSSSQDNKNEYYLTPGDIFIVKKVNKRSRINAEPIATSKGIFNDSLIFHDSLSARILHLEKDKDDCYEFNNYPLDVVFDQLQIIYNTKIIYNKAELGNRSFIGKIDKKDSLSHILKSIAVLNNFDLHKQGDGFIISN
ncbi:MAG TPA: FecR family protein [Bacteroidia bacterium]|nr:FecR family protein [Bacteroidia bacterium]